MQNVTYYVNLYYFYQYPHESPHKLPLIGQLVNNVGGGTLDASYNLPDKRELANPVTNRAVTGWVTIPVQQSVLK